MEEDVSVYARNCAVCQSVNLPHHARPVPLQKLPLAKAFNDRVHVDLMGGWPVDQGFKYLMVLQDAHTKWVELCPLVDKSAEEAAGGIVRNWIDRHGVMRQIVSDQGKEFVNHILAEVCKSLHVEHQTTSVGHPQSNGLVERSNRTIIAYLRKYLDGKNTWVALLPMLQFSFNTAPHASLQRSPYVALYLRRPNVPGNLYADPHMYAEEEMSQLLDFQARVQREVLSAENEAWKTQKEQFDKAARVKHIQVGDVVYVDRPHSGHQFQKFQPLYFGPCIVVEVTKHENLVVKRDDGKLIQVHKNRVKLGSFGEQLFQDFPSDLPSTLPTRPVERQPPPVDSEEEDEEFGSPGVEAETPVSPKGTPAARPEGQEPPEESGTIVHPSPSPQTPVQIEPPPSAEPGPRRFGEEDLGASPELILRKFPGLRLADPPAQEEPARDAGPKTKQSRADRWRAFFKGRTPKLTRKRAKETGQKVEILWELTFEEHE